MPELPVPDYSSWTLYDWAFYACICGPLGWLFSVVANNALIRPPSQSPDGKGFQLNTIGDIIAASGIACLADHNFLIATSAAACTKALIPALIKAGEALAPWIFKRSGG